MIKLHTLKVNQLNTLLRANDLPLSGTKANKILKLQDVLGVDEVDANEIEDESSTSTNDIRLQLNSLKEAMTSLTAAISTIAQNATPAPNNSETQQQVNDNDDERQESISSWGSANDLRRPIRREMSIQDMIGVMPEFDPLKGSTSSIQFITRTEQLQQCYNWREDRVLIAVQHKLKGMAKRWLDAQSVFQTWSEFREAFKIDFPTTYNAAETHKSLIKRKRKIGEDYLEYYYSMLTIGRQGMVDDKSINTHIISGLNDTILVKTLATMNLSTCSELLVALKNLTAVSSVSATSTIATQQAVKAETKTDGKPTQIKCFNCNGFGHIAAKCPQPQRKPRCTVCTKVGHEAKNCNKKPTVAKIVEQDNNNPPPVTKTVEVEERNWKHSSTQAAYVH